MNGQIYAHVHVYGGYEPEYTNGRKNFILRPRLEVAEQHVFSSLQGGRGEFLKQLSDKFFHIRFKF